MRTAILGISTGLLVLAAPLLPLAAHAHMGLGLSGAAALELNGIASESILDAAAEVDADVATNPVVITRTSLESKAGIETAAAAPSPLEAYAHSLVQEDANVSAVVLSSNNVALSYRMPAKLLGLFSVNVPVTVSANASGKMEVSYPWYSFLLSTDRVALSIRAEAAAANALSAHVASETELSALDQVRLMNSLHMTLKSQTELQIAAQNS